MTNDIPVRTQSAPDLADDLMLLARLVESEAELAARPGQLDRLDAIANRLRALSGIAAERVAALAAPGVDTAASAHDLPDRLTAGADALESIGWAGMAYDVRDLASQLSGGGDMVRARAVLSAALAARTPGGPS